VVPNGLRLTPNVFGDGWKSALVSKIADLDSESRKSCNGGLIVLFLYGFWRSSVKSPDSQKVKNRLGRRAWEPAGRRFGLGIGSHARQRNRQRNRGKGGQSISCKGAFEVANTKSATVGFKEKGQRRT
jgi:hypothetical protein